MANQKEQDEKIESEELKLDLTDHPRSIVKYRAGEDSSKLFDHIKNYSAVKSDIIMFILANALHQGTRRIKFSPKQLKEFIGYKKSVSAKEFVNLIRWVFHDLASVTYASKEIVNGELHEINRPFFEYTDVNMATLWVTVQIAEQAATMFNNFSARTRFNRFSLLQYFQIQSKYSKNLFRLLKQWRTRGHYTYTVEQLKQDLAIPKSYRPADINRRIIQRSKEELAPYFANFHVEIEPARENRSTKYIFYWKPEKNRAKDFYADPKMMKLIAYYNIADNQYLTKATKDRAVERYFDLKKGQFNKENKKNAFYFLDLIYGADYDHDIVHSIGNMDNNLLIFLKDAYEKLDQDKRLSSVNLSTLLMLKTELDKRDSTNQDEIKIDLEGIPQVVEKDPIHIEGYTYLKSSDRIKALEQYQENDLNMLLQRLVKASDGVTGQKKNLLISDIGVLSAYILQHK